MPDPLVVIIPQKQLDLSHHNISGMSFSRDGKYIYTGGGWEDGQLCRWLYPFTAGQSGQELFNANDRMATFNDIISSPDGKFIVAAGHELRAFTTISSHKVWRYISGKPTFSSDGQTLLAVSGDSLIAWDFKSGEFHQKYRVNYEDCSDLRSLCLSVDNQYVYIGERNGSIIQARFSDGEETNRFKKHSYIVRDLVCTKNILVSASDDAKVLFWNIDHKKQTLTLKHSYYPNGNYVDAKNAPIDWSYEDIEISPKGQFIVFASRATLPKDTPVEEVEARYVCRIVFWSLESCTLVHEIVTPKAHEPGLSFHPTQPILAIKGKSEILSFDYSHLLDKK